MKRPVQPPPFGCRLIALAAVASLLMGLFGGVIGSKLGNPKTGPTSSIQGGQTVNVQESSATIEAVKKVSPGVVSITTEGQAGGVLGAQTTTGGGTGFVITNDGLIATNRHVVEAAQQGLTVVTTDGTSYKGTVAAVDPILDFALIKIDAKNLPVVALGDSDALQVGQNVIAVGNALGEFSNTVTTGVISAKERDIQAGTSNSTESLANLLQTDAAINPGNSGGPLVNLAGQVVGVNTAVSESAQGIGFAIPINQAKQAIDSYTSNGKIVRASLGVRYIPVSKEVAQLYRLPVDSGAYLRGSQGAPAVIAGSPAATAGLQDGDIIISFDGKKLDQNTTLGELIAAKQPGNQVEIKYRRGGEEKTATVTLSAR